MMVEIDFESIDQEFREIEDIYQNETENSTEESLQNQSKNDTESLVIGD